MEQGKTYENATEDSMRIFLAGGESRHWIQDELLETQKKNDMQIFLAGQNGMHRIISDAVISCGSMAMAKRGGV